MRTLSDDLYFTLNTTSSTSNRYLIWKLYDDSDTLLFNGRVFFKAGQTSSKVYFGDIIRTLKPMLDEGSATSSYRAKNMRRYYYAKLYDATGETLLQTTSNMYVILGYPIPSSDDMRAANTSQFDYFTDTQMDAAEFIVCRQFNKFDGTDKTSQTWDVYPRYPRTTAAYQLCSPRFTIATTSGKSVNWFVYNLSGGYQQLTSGVSGNLFNPCCSYMVRSTSYSSYAGLTELGIQVNGWGYESLIPEMEIHALSDDDSSESADAPIRDTSISSGSGTGVKDPQVFAKKKPIVVKLADIDDCPARYYLRWEDRFGSAMCWPFEGKETRTMNYSKTNIEDSAGYSRLSTMQNDLTFDLNTDWLSDKHMEVFESILTSPYLWLIDTLQQIRHSVLVDDKSYIIKTRQNQGKKLFNLNIKVKTNKKENIIY